MSSKRSLTRKTLRLCSEVVHWPTPRLDSNGSLQIVSAAKELSRREKSLVSLVGRLPAKSDAVNLLEQLRRAKQLVFRNELSRQAKKRVKQKRNERKKVAAQLDKWLAMAEQIYVDVDPDQSYYGSDDDDVLTRIGQLQSALGADPIFAERSQKASTRPADQSRAWRGPLRAAMNHARVPDALRPALLRVAGLQPARRAPSRRK